MPPEVQGVLEQVTAWQTLIWAGVIVGALTAVYRAWPVLSRFVRTVNALSDLPEFMESVRKQLENDHGQEGQVENMREELTMVRHTGEATQAAIAELSAWQKKHEAITATAHSRIRALESREKK